MIKKIKTYIEIIEKKEVANLVILILFLLIVMIIETLSIGIILPIFSELTNTKGTGNNFFSKYFIRIFFPKDTKPTLNNLLIILLAIYFVKLVFIAFVSWFQNKVIYKVQENLSIKLFSVYLHRPYTFHLQKNTATLIQHMTGGINAFRDLIQAFVTFFFESLVLLGIAIALILAEPIGSLVVILMFGLVSVLFMLTIKKKVYNWGKSYLHQESM